MTVRRLTNRRDVDTLRATVDSIGVDEVLNVLAAICADKSRQASADALKFTDPAYRMAERAVAWDYVGTYASALADKVPAIIVDGGT